MKPVRSEDRIVRNLHTAPFIPFVSDDGTAHAGQSYVQLDESRPAGTGMHLYRMAPGAVSTPHEHNCDELFYVIEGELIDNDGARYVAGDMVLLRPGTQHFSHTPNGCTLLVHIETAETNIARE